MKVLVACEFSGKVRDAFRDLGHEAWSCDFEKPEGRFTEHHYQDDVFRHLDKGWDLMIAHPPCTHLAVSGARWWPQKEKEQKEAITFVLSLYHSAADRVAIENPIGKLSSAWRKPDQIVQPWQFGHGETKATCFWLRGLPPLDPTSVVPGREARVHKMPPSKDRWKLRSITYQGIAEAMALQWGS